MKLFIHVVGLLLASALPTVLTAPVPEAVSVEARDSKKTMSRY